MSAAKQKELREKQLKERAEKDAKALKAMENGFGLKTGMFSSEKQTTNEERLAAVKAYDDRSGAPRDNIIKELKDANRPFTIKYLQASADQRAAISAEAASKNPKFPFNAGEVPTNGGGKKKRRKPKKKASKSGGRSKSRSRSRSRSKSRGKGKSKK